MPTLTAPDGALLVYDMYEAAAPRAAVLGLHGWADHAGRWRDVGERLCAAGYSTYLLDLRGHGRSGGRRGHLSRFSQLLGDLQAFRRVRSEEHTSELQSLRHLVCRLLLEKKNKTVMY